jgi:hypothetical protein
MVQVVFLFLLDYVLVEAMGVLAAVLLFLFHFHHCDCLIQSFQTKVIG